MIVLLGASALSLAALQASINAPTEAFRGCLREAIEAYLRNACGVQMSSLKTAVIAFRVKNGMAKKAAADDANMTVDDYLATPVDNYKFLATMNAPAQPQPATMQPAAATPQQPK
jgi:hypothetical protein